MNWAIRSTFSIYYFTELKITIIHSDHSQHITYYSTYLSVRNDIIVFQTTVCMYVQYKSFL